MNQGKYLSTNLSERHQAMHKKYGNLIHLNLMYTRDLSPRNGMISLLQIGLILHHRKSDGLKNIF